MEYSGMLGRNIEWLNEPAIPLLEPAPWLDHPWPVKIIAQNCLTFKIGPKIPLKSAHLAPQKLWQLVPSVHQGWRKTSNKDKKKRKKRREKPGHNCRLQHSFMLDEGRFHLERSWQHRVHWDVIFKRRRAHLFCSQKIWWGHQCGKRTKNTHPTTSSYISHKEWSWFTSSCTPRSPVR